MRAPPHRHQQPHRTPLVPTAARLCPGPYQATLRGALSVALVCLALLFLVIPAFAQEQPRLQTQITDLTRSQVLTAGRSQIESALTTLRQEQNIQLFVLFTETTGSQTVTDYASSVARGNSLGGNDVLLVVALADRSDALWRSDQMADRLTDRELSDLLSDRVEPRLADGNFADAVVAAAEGVGAAATSSGSQSGQPLAGLGALLMPLLALVLVGAGGFWLWSVVRTKRRERAAAEERERELAKLDQEANALLIAADDAFNDAGLEIEFAEAQFGAAEVVPYREAVKRASTELQSAFALRQELDDDEPEAPDERRPMIEQLLGHVRTAKSALDEQRQRIEQLRDIERRAPEILAALPAQLDAVGSRIPEAEQTLAGLQRYADETWSSVAENVDHARDLLTLARETVDEGTHALAADDRSSAGRHARLGQQAYAEIGRLLDAIKSLAETVRQAEAAAGPQIDAAAADVRAARAALARSTPAGRSTVDVEMRLDQADALLRRAQQAQAEAKPDVLEASRLATQADTIADDVLAELREEAERRERERRLVAAQLQSAEASYARASHFVSARRRGVGRAARTRLAEADRHLTQARALADTDPQAALSHARRAHELAEAAYTLARQDMTDGFGMFGGHSRGGMFPFPVPMSGGGWPKGGGSWGGGGAVGGGWGGGGGGAVGGRW